MKSNQLTSDNPSIGGKISIHQRGRENFEKLNGEKNQFTAEVVNTSKLGIEIKIGSKIYTASAQDKFFKGERIVLENYNSLSKDWKVVQRSYSVVPNYFEMNTNGILIGNKLNNIHRRELTLDIIESFFRQESEKIDIQTKDIPKILNQLFPYFSWDLDTYILEWMWKEAEATAYLQSSNDSNNFLLEYNSEGTGLCRFLFNWNITRDDWNIFASIQDLHFYKIILNSSNELRNSLLSVVSKLTKFEIEFISTSNILSNKGWVA